MIGRLLKNLWHSRQGTAAVEFGLVSMPFIALLLAVMQVGLALYTQETLDYATQYAARQIQIGAVSTSMTAAAFQSTVFCPKMAPLMPCSGLSFSLKPVADFYTDAAVTLVIPTNAAPGSGFTFCPGTPGQLMFLRVVYQAPAYSRMWWTGIANSTSPTTRSVQSTAAFVIETATILSSVPGGGC